MEKSRLRTWIAAMVLVILYALDIVVGGRIAGMTLPLPAASMVPEAALILIAVVVVLGFKGNVKEAFPFKKPEFLKIVGTILIWLGTFLGTMLVTMITAYFFPKEIMGVNEQIGGMMGGLSLPVALIMVAVTPAVCEELSFRGALYYFLKEKGNKWAPILVTAAIFGIFHGSIWRFLPTAVLGVVMGWLLYESGNMFYNMLFHFVNNAVPVLLMFATSNLVEAASPGMEEIPGAVVGAYMLYASAAPFLVYAGNYLFHKKDGDRQRKLMPREKHRILACMTIISVLMITLGMLIIMNSVAGLF